MDPLTQGLLGASVGGACYGRVLGRRALAWGALVGMAPDLDVLASATSPMAEWLWHRGPTHALVFGPVVGPAIGWLLWKRLGGRLRHWVGLCVAALFTHPLLDAFTTYGTQLLWPFSRRRVAFDAVAIVDPAYSLILAVALVLGLRWGAGRRRGRRPRCGSSSGSRWGRRHPASTMAPSWSSTTCGTESPADLETGSGACGSGSTRRDVPSDPASGSTARCPRRPPSSWVSCGVRRSAHPDHVYRARRGGGAVLGPADRQLPAVNAPVPSC